MIHNLLPMYGRDYRSRAAVQKDWNNGFDFEIADLSDPYCGKPVNIHDAKVAGWHSVNIRYAKLRKVAVIKVAS